jgi:hypothetical protein
LLEYAIQKDTKKLIHVFNVDNGLNCNCICPSCGAILSAHQGRKKAHHFKHNNSAVCNSSEETALHLKAKEIIEKYKKITIPRLDAKLKDIVIPVVAERIINFDSVLAEKREGEIVPDIIGFYKGRKILIEIFVTHRVDVEKKKYIRERDISCIEIDLSNFYNKSENLDEDFLVKNIISDVSDKTWVHHTQYRSAIKKAREESKKAINKKIELCSNVKKPSYNFNIKNEYLDNPIVVKRPIDSKKYLVKIIQKIRKEDIPSKYEDKYIIFQITGSIKSISDSIGTTFKVNMSIRGDKSNYFITIKEINNISIFNKLSISEREFSDLIFSHIIR